MLKFINKIIITYNTYKINSRLIKEKTAALNAKDKRDLDIAMTNIAIKNYGLPMKRYSTGSILLGICSETLSGDASLFKSCNWLVIRLL